MIYEYVHKKQNLAMLTKTMKMKIHNDDDDDDDGGDDDDDDDDDDDGW